MLSVFKMTKYGPSFDKAYLLTKVPPRVVEVIGKQYLCNGRTRTQKLIDEGKYIRYDIDEFGNIKVYCVKNMGNHRFWMKKLANRGASCEYLMKVKFHEGIVDTALTQEDFIRIEAAAHHADAGDRNTQVEGQKFASGLAAKIPRNGLLL